jgi:hypothetical protein
LLPLLLLTSAPCLAAKLELEVGAGATSARAFDAPSLTGRIGLDFFDHLTPSLRALALTPVGRSDLSAWALLGEVRAHTSGRFQLNAGLGVGVGSARFAPGPGTGVSARLDRVAPYLMGDVGARLCLWKFWVGLNVGGSPSSPGLMATLSLGWAPLES